MSFQEQEVEKKMSFLILSLIRINKHTEISVPLLINNERKKISFCRDKWLQWQHYGEVYLGNQQKDLEIGLFSFKDNTEVTETLNVPAHLWLIPYLVPPFCVSSAVLTYM